MRARVPLDTYTDAAEVAVCVIWLAARDTVPVEALEPRRTALEP